MSRFTEITFENFIIREEGKTKTILTLKKGISCVVFGSIKCEFTKAIVPVMEKLCREQFSRPLNMHYFMLEKGKNDALFRFSQQTTTPISGTPKIFFYINGKPRIEYKGGKDFKSLSLFCHDFVDKFAIPILDSGNERKVVIKKENIDKLERMGGAIPYNIVCDKEKCYLIYSEIGKTSLIRQ